jgi:hypothetical protein
VELRRREAFAEGSRRCEAASDLSSGLPSAHGWPRDPASVGAPNPTQGDNMNMTFSIGPLVALIAGILILVVPRLLNFIVAIYLIIIGLLGLFGGNLHL